MTMEQTRAKKKIKVIVFLEEGVVLDARPWWGRDACVVAVDEEGFPSSRCFILLQVISGRPIVACIKLDPFE